MNDNKASQGPPSATLLFDGQCGICKEWVDYWHHLTGDSVIYRPYQEAASDYPDIPVPDLEAAIHLVEDNGRITRGAEATFKLYQGVQPQNLLLLLYRYLPGFQLLSEVGYNYLSRHRGLLAFFTHLFWGKRLLPSTYHVTSWCFLRLLGCIYLVAFTSFAVQALALIGTEGILPLDVFMSAARQQLGGEMWFRLPTLFWFLQSDGFIQLLSIAGMVLSLFLITGLLVRTSLVLLYVLYLSIVHGSQVFMSFQWDMLLLECGFLAIFLPWGSTIVVWLYRWLVFRFMFLSGVVKIMSGDPNWLQLTAMNYHFETQPLTTPIAWYAHHLPEILLKAATGMTLVIELLLPIFIFTPRCFRHLAAWSFLLLQATIFVTGNYNFFNLLTIIICLFLFDDAAIKRLIPARLLDLGSINKAIKTRVMAKYLALVMAVICLYMGSIQIYRYIERDQVTVSFLYRFFMPFGIVNSYGPFAVMTTVRNEIVLEGSNDGSTWQEYHFKYKPGNLEKCPGWVAPHQPRVDWQMWFAALSPPQQQFWFLNFMVRLLQNSETVTSLLETNPFPDTPPNSIRALYYEYTFTGAEERRASGRCWNRRLIGEYYPPVSLNQRN